MTDLDGHLVRVTVFFATIHPAKVPAGDSFKKLKL